MSFDRTLSLAALLVLVACAPAHAQTSNYDFFPEFDGYFHINSNAQIVFQAKEALEAGDLARSQLGPSVEFYLRPLKALKDITVFDLDEAKCMPVLVSIGYRYMPSPNAPTKNRMEPIAEFHVPVWGRILLTDRNRADLDWENHTFDWRYRNRVTAERRVRIHSYHPAPYASAEFFYTSKYAKWSTTREYAGCLLPIGRHFQLDPYYEHANNTGTRPNHQLNAAGLILSLYISPEKK